MFVKYPILKNAILSNPHIYHVGSTGSRVGEGSGEAVAGMGVGGGVSVGKREATGVGVGVTVWISEGDTHEEVRRRNPTKRIFFMMIPYRKTYHLAVVR